MHFSKDSKVVGTRFILWGNFSVSNMGTLPTSFNARGRLNRVRRNYNFQRLANIHDTILSHENTTTCVFNMHDVISKPILSSMCVFNITFKCIIVPCLNENTIYCIFVWFASLLNLWISPNSIVACAFLLIFHKTIYFI